MTRKEKTALKVNEKRISRAYAVSCSGIQISIWDMSKIMDVGHAAIASGADDAALGVAIRAFVETIRKN